MPFGAYCEAHRAAYVRLVESPWSARAILRLSNAPKRPNRPIHA